jgi:hypothetical protein
MKQIKGIAAVLAMAVWVIARQSGWERRGNLDEKRQP